MKPIELFENHPLTTKKIQDWFMDRMLESFKDSTIDDDFKQRLYQEGISLDKLCVFLETQPRGFFDIFDDNNIIILIKYNPNIGFTWCVEEDSENNYFPTRKEAETEALEAAFLILEEELINKIVVN